MEDTKKIDAASTTKAIIQMGHSCEVVLTRLTKEETEKYSRRTQSAPVKEENKDSCVRKHLNSTSMKKKRARVIYSSDEESTGNSSGIESVKKKKKHGHIKHHNPEKTLHENSILKNTENCSDKEKSTFTNNIKKSHSIQVCDLNEGPECPMEVRKEKCRRKFKLLFGDDYDDSDETEKRKSKYESRKHSSVPTPVSATINFNNYSDHASVQTVSSVHKTSEKHWKENGYKHVHKSHKNKHKRKIEYDRTSKKSEIQRIEKLYTKVIKNDTVVEHLPKNNVKSDKSKSKSNNFSPKRNDSDNVDNTALFQGIWSSLGMQSPENRSDRIISNTLSETCTLYKAVNSKNDILLASGIATELNKSSSVSLKLKYVDKNSSENDGTVPVETSFPIDNSQKMSLVNTGKVQSNKNKEIDSNNKSTIVQSGPTSDREDLVKRTIEVDENAVRPTEHDIKPECNIAESNKCTDSCNLVNASVLKSYHETEVSQTVRKSSSSEMCSTIAEKAAADEQHTENYHIIATDPENPMSRPVSFIIDLCDSADDTSRPEAFSSDIPASVGSASGTESFSSCVIESVDEESNIGSCSSVEIVETGATDITLVTCDSKPASEKNNNMSNTATSDSENHVGTSDINLVTSGSNATSDNSQSKSVLSESKNLINSTVSNVSEERVSACNSENSTTINDGIVTNNNIGKIRVKDPKSLGIQSFVISNSDQFATAEIVVAPELRRQSTEEKRRHSVEEHRIQSVEVHRRRSVEDMTIEELIASGSSGQNLSESDILVFRNYKKYFNNLLESKLPKLGELLYLAVADSVRKDLRIHQSGKLSSPDLVKQEKMKAEKDFSNGLKARGIEFTALLDSIVKKFDLHCAEDMVFALYSRILYVFKLIDKQNKKHITRTRIIIQKMLQKNSYRNEIVYKILSMETSDFSQSLSRISHCILTYNNMAKVAGNNMSETQPTLQFTQDATITIQANSGIENMSDPKTVDTNAQLLEKGTSGPIINVCSTSEPRAPINTTVQANSSSSPSDQHSSSNSFSWDAFFSKILEHPVDNRKQLTSDTATVASQHVTDFSYNRNPASYGHLPSYSSHLLPSVNNVGIVGNQNLSSAYYGSNAGNVNHINNLQANNSVFDINRVSNSSVMHLQNSNDHTAGSMASAGNDLGRQNIGSHQQINNIQQIKSSMNQQEKLIMRKRLVQLTPNSCSMNSTAVARNQSAVMQTNDSNISLYKRSKNNRSNNQQCQNSLLSRQELNSLSSRTNNNHSKISNVVNSGGTDTLDRRSQKSDSSVMRNQNVMQPAGNVHSKLINQNPAAVGIQRNSPYVNNVRQFHQMESSGRMAYTQAPVNWHARDLVINSGVMTTIPAASNLNYSPIQVNSNVNYSNQNTGNVVNKPSGSSVETTVQSNKLPQQQPNSNVQNRSSALQPTGVIQRVNTGDLQQLAGNRPPPPPYSLTKSELLLQYLLKQDNVGSLTYPESENLKKVVEDRVYSQNQSVLAGNHKMASRVVGQQNGNVPTWNLPRNVPLRPQDSQIGSISVEPNGRLLYNSVDTSVSNGNVPPNNVNTKKITIGANPKEISYKRIRQVGGVHNMKSHRNVQIAPRNISKTQDRLPVISEVFTCGNFTLPGQNMSTSNNDAASVTNTATNNITSHNASGNAFCPSSLQSINSNVVTQLNNNTGRSPVVLTHSKEVPVSTYTEDWYNGHSDKCHPP